MLLPRLVARVRSICSSRASDDFDIGGNGLSRPILGSPQGAKHNSRRDTDWLDGLRGYAALLVFFTHFAFSYWHQVRLVYGTVIPLETQVWSGEYFPYVAQLYNGTRVISSTEEQQNYHLLQLPILRLLSYGEPMVVIFFIVSGYSLSLKPISLMLKGHAGQSQMLTHLASSIFRRPIRLLAPVTIGTFLVAFGTGIGLYKHAASFANVSDSDFHGLFGGWAHELTPIQKDNLWLQLKDWFFSLSDLFDFFTHFQWPASRYDNHLWTIPVEFRCSMFLFLSQAATAFFTSRFRLTLLSIFVVGGLTWGDTWEMAVFWAGMALCEVNTIYPPVSQSYFDQPQQRNLLRRGTKISFFLLGLYLASMPRSYALYTPFYSTLAGIHIPGLRGENQSRFWQCTGCILSVSILSRSLPLKRFFSNKAAKYLGRISFALYIVHGPILRGLGYSTAIVAWSVVGNDSAARYNAGVAITAAVVFPTVFALAHLFTFFVDEPLVRFARALDGRLRLAAERREEWTAEDEDKYRAMDSPMMVMVDGNGMA
ncbi:hypothetical protein ANO11243_032840 [Dothideomycetidae sp. 11243]|nr:hypothetical protein ANO11243_032840 [fungal sp. No.11243]